MNVNSSKLNILITQYRDDDCQFIFCIWVKNSVLEHGGPGRMGWMVGGGLSPADSKVGITDALGIESHHGHLVHRGEVGLDHVDTLPVSLKMLAHYQNGWTVLVSA